MVDNVEELFGRGADTPEPKLGRIWFLLISGLLLTVLGLACVSVPGGVVVLLAIGLAEKEKDRVDNGYLPEVDRSRVLWVRTASYTALAMCTVVFFLQCYLYSQGVYAALGDLFFAGQPPDWITDLIT